MSSDQKIAANQTNAQASTGPVTAAGKAASAQNARKHGLSARHLFIPDDRQGEFNEMYLAYLKELQPLGEIQGAHFEQLIHALWNLNIARELHAVALSHLDHKNIANAARYLSQFERSFAKALKMLKDEQTDFALRAVPENEPIAGLPASCRIEKISSHATRLAQQQERTHRPAHRAAVLTAIAHVFAACPQPQTAAPQPQQKPQQNEANSGEPAALDLAA